MFHSFLFRILDFDFNRWEHTKIKKTARGLPHPLLTDFDGKSTTVAYIFSARLRASCSAAPTDACKPTPLAESNDPVPDTSDHPRTQSSGSALAN